MHDFSTSLVPKPLTVVIGLGMRLDGAHAYKIKKWCPSQQTAAGQCWEQLFDYSKFEAMKSVSGWDAAHCDEHQFRKIKVST